MKQISSSATIFIRISPIIFWIIFNFLFLAINGFHSSRKEFLSFEGAAVLMLGLFSLWTFRYWTVESDGNKIILTRWRKKISFTIHDIQNIEAVSNPFRRSNYAETMPTKIILNSDFTGRREFIFYPDSDESEDQFLIVPWQKLRIERAQKSLKKRKVRR